MSEQLDRGALESRIEALETFVSELEEMLETDDSIPPTAMEMYERNLAESKKRLEGLKGFRAVLEDLNG
jgi:hypothetical protein